MCNIAITNGKSLITQLFYARIVSKNVKANIFPLDFVRSASRMGVTKVIVSELWKKLLFAVVEKYQEGLLHAEIMMVLQKKLE